ncbi:hypothetical protein EG829_01295 [bacterium]|nr:hypothetical protein [bacterium]
MMKRTILVGFIVLFTAFPVTVDAGDPVQPPGTVLDKKKKTDGSTDKACDCCKQCEAARKPVKPEVEEGPPASNGCGDCCERCGRAEQPLPEKIPPEVIQKK